MANTSFRRSLGILYMIAIIGGMFLITLGLGEGTLFNPLMFSGFGWIAVAGFSLLIADKPFLNR